MFNPENAAGTVQTVQKISGKTMKKNVDCIASQIHKTSVGLAFVHAL